MIVGLISTVMGFVTSFLPDVFKFFNKKQDQAHELKLYDLQMEAAKQGHVLEIDKLHTEAEIEQLKGLYDHDKSFTRTSPWMDNLRASVRPIVTYLMLAFYISMKISLFWILTGGEVTTQEAFISVWTDEDAAIFGAIMGFWFGSRQSLRKTLVDSVYKPVKSVISNENIVKDKKKSNHENSTKRNFNLGADHK